MPRYKFIINPIPLKNKHMMFLKELKHKMTKDNIDFSYEYTTKSRNATLIAKDAVKKYDIVVACGGDGTVMEVINGLFGTKSRLGIFPFGTSNDFANHLGINPRNYADILFRGNSNKIDLGMAEFRRNNKTKKMLFCSTSGIGFDAKLLKLNRYNSFIRMKKILGNLIYTTVSLFLIFLYRSSEVEIKFNNKNVKTKLFMLNANFVKSMSGIKVSPNADVNNEVFDIIVFEDANIFKKIIGLVWYSITSKKLKFKEIDYISRKNSGENRYNLHDVKSFSITSKNPIELQLNGDFVGYTPARFRILPKALYLIK